MYFRIRRTLLVIVPKFKPFDSLYRNSQVFAHETKYYRMDQVKFVEDSLWKIWRDIVCLSRPYPFKFFKGCLSQILLGPFLNILFI